MHFQTWSGKTISLLAPRPTDIHILDIAFGLAVPRFNRATRRPITVAEHSVRMSFLTDEPLLAKQLLLHDAHEYLLGDIISPVQVAIRQLVADATGSAVDPVEDLKIRLQAAVNQRFGLPNEPDPRVRDIDLRMLVTERRDLMRPTGESWGKEVDAKEPLPLKIRPWDGDDAVGRFLQRFSELWPEERYHEDLAVLAVDSSWDAPLSQIPLQQP